MEEPRFREVVSKIMVQVGRELRQQQTSAESLLWEYLRDRRLADIKFRRQHPLANTTYIADFYSYEHHLVIELDGSIHDEPQQQQADLNRQQEIEALGERVLRFRNEQIFKDIEGVLTDILKTINPNNRE